MQTLFWGAGHTDSVEAVAFSRVQPVAATASMDGQMLVWDNSTLGVRSTCPHGEVCASELYPSLCHPSTGKRNSYQGLLLS